MTMSVNKLKLFLLISLQAKLLESSHAWLGASTSSIAGKSILAMHVKPTDRIVPWLRHVRRRQLVVRLPGLKDLEFNILEG